MRTPITFVIFVAATSTAIAELHTFTDSKGRTLEADFADGA